MPRIPTFPVCFDEVNRLNISSLRGWGYLKPGGWKTGIISWSHGGEQTSSIGITVFMSQAYVRLEYLLKGKRIDEHVRLESLPSNLGKGRVWYFVCPETGKRCRKLYRIGERFLSRSAYPGVMYKKQVQLKRLKELSAAFDVLLVGEQKDKFLTKRYAKPFYKDKPTRRFQAILNRQERVERQFLEIVPDEYWEMLVMNKP